VVVVVTALTLDTVATKSTIRIPATFMQISGLILVYSMPNQVDSVLRGIPTDSFKDTVLKANVKTTEFRQTTGNKALAIIFNLLIIKGNIPEVDRTLE
jgi:hypothetical protein